MLLFFAVNPSFAHLHDNEESDKPFNFKSPDDPGSFQAVDHAEEYYGCSGYLRTGFIQTDHQSASAIAGELGCGYQLNSYIKGHIGLFASIDPGWNSHNDQIILEKAVEGKFVENLDKKVKESLTDNGHSPYQELFCRIFRPDFFTNLSSGCISPNG